jgi:hypothetical protein
MKDITIIGCFSNNTHNDAEDGSLMLCIPQLNSEYDNFYKIWMKYIKKYVSHGDDNLYINDNYVDDDDNNVYNNDDDDKVKYKNNYDRNDELNEYLSCSIWLNDQKPITKGFKLSTTFICSWEDKNMKIMKEKLYKTCNLFQQHKNKNKNVDDDNDSKSYDTSKRKSKTTFSSNNNYDNSSSRRISDFLPANSNVVLLGNSISIH